MKIISHRGNVDGKNVEMENSLGYLQNAIGLGLDVEVDLWIIDGNIYFGHDKPQYPITQKEFNSIKKHSWFHCKNLEAITYCINNKNVRYFWHQQDDFTLTSNGYIWTYPGKEITKKSILVTFNDYPINHLVRPYAICTDNPRLYI